MVSLFSKECANLHVYINFGKASATAGPLFFEFVSFVNFFVHSLLCSLFMQAASEIFSALKCEFSSSKVNRYITEQMKLF